MRITIDLSEQDIKRVDRYRDYLTSGPGDGARILRERGFVTSDAVLALVKDALYRHEYLHDRLEAVELDDPAELAGLAELDNVMTVVVPAWLRSLQSEQESAL